MRRDPSMPIDGRCTARNGPEVEPLGSAGVIGRVPVASREAVGPAGAGKSTWAAARFRATQVVSSDALRAVVADDPTDQGATGDAFRLLHAIVRARLKRGLTAVVDATNLTEGARRPLLAAAAAAGRPAVAVVFDVPLDICLARNASRTDRVVPDDVVRLHHAQLPAAIAGLRHAGVPILPR